MDIVGPLPKAPGNKVYMLAMTDYFSKWIEAESFSQVTEAQVISFIKRNIICRFGIPSEIICDNGSQFIGNKTEAFCASWNISLQKSTPRNPQSNGQAETTPKVATGQTPFSLVFGAEAVIPSEVRVPTHRYGCLTEERNQVEMASSLDTVDELRTSAQIRMASYRQTVARSYNKNIKVRTLQLGRTVLGGKYRRKWSLQAHDNERANGPQIVEYYPPKEISHLKATRTVSN
ncbi:uncharacterized protein LOC141655050 [Silene latifolia]|uniref:uncharacterized protein LOC141655050 n=1 Tax=Silene latifolia TaxID=37657 RepID=UPI003D778974